LGGGGRVRWTSGIAVAPAIECRACSSEMHTRMLCRVYGVGEPTPEVP